MRRKMVRRALAGLAAMAMMTGGLSATARAEEPAVAVDQEVLADRLFGGIVESRLQQDDRVTVAVLSAELLEWWRLHPDASFPQTHLQFRTRENLLNNALTFTDRRLPEPDLVLRSLDVLLSSAGGNTRTAPHVKALAEAVLGPTLEPWDRKDEHATGSMRIAQWLRDRDAALSAVWSDVRRTAHADPRFAQVWNQALGSREGLDATTSFEELKSNPVYTQRVDIDAILSRREDPEQYLAEAKRQIDTLHAALVAVQAEARADAVQGAAKNPPDGKPAGEDPAREKREAEERHKTRQATIDDLKAGVGLVSGLIDFHDKAAAKKAKVIGEAMTTTASAISKYAAAIAGRDVLGAIFSTATLSLTGNVFGAVMSVVSLFGKSEPSLDRQILDQVKALREEVAKLGNEMRENFAKVEAQINNLYTSMLFEFDKLNAAIAGQTAQLQVLQSAIASLGLRLEDVAATILSAIGDAELVGLRVAINEYIGYADTHEGRQIPSQSEYDQVEAKFNFAATDQHKDGAFVVSKDKANDPDVDPGTTLDVSKEANSVDYLARLAHRRDPSVPDPASLVGNPTVWNVGARAYSMLQIQNPGYADQISPSRATDVEAAGLRIQELTQSFARPVTDDPDGIRTSRLLRSLMADYRTGVDSLSAELRALRENEIQSRYELTGPDLTPVKRLKNYPLFWVPGQPVGPLQLQDELSHVAPCGSGSAILRPSNVGLATLPGPFRLALNAFAPRFEAPPAGIDELPSARHCFSVFWTHTSSSGSVSCRISNGRLTLRMHTEFRMRPGQPFQPARTLTYMWPNIQVYERENNSFAPAAACQNMSLNPRTELDNRWDASRPTFEQQATAVNNHALEAQVATEVHTFLVQRQAKMYQLVDQALDQPASPIAVAMKKMNTAARLLQAYTRLGMPIALGADDVLSAILFGRHKLPVSKRIDPQIRNAYQTAFGNYSCGGSACPADPERPVRNQADFVPCTPDAPNLPGDPLGDCVIDNALERLDVLRQRYEEHASQVAAGQHREHLPWLSNTLTALRVTNAIVQTP